MPTYQYRCTHCGHEFEEYQSIVEDPISKCPNCSKKPERVISGGAGFLFKGSGFYITDHRSDNYKKAASKEKKEKSGSNASETKQSDSKKSEGKPKPSSSKSEN